MAHKTGKVQAGEEVACHTEVTGWVGHQHTEVVEGRRGGGLPLAPGGKVAVSVGWQQKVTLVTQPLTWMKQWMGS